MTAICANCGERFHRDVDEGWKKLCLRCWIATQPPRPAKVDPIRDELREHLRALLQLVHPDRHNGSQAATVETQWLLDVRARLERALARSA